MRIGYLTAAPFLEDDSGEPGEQLQSLERGSEPRDIELTPVAWDDRSIENDAFDAFVIGSTWDYMTRADEFLDQLTHFAATRPLLNPLEIVKWNSDKRYLHDLENRGVPIVPTQHLPSPDRAKIDAAFAHFDADEIVVKPAVGAGAWRQLRLRRDQAIDERELHDGALLVQPFLPTILDEGEYSFVYFDREFSHCTRKTPVDGDYRIQAEYGGRDLPHSPDDRDLRSAQRVVDAIDGPLLYARVDMIRDGDELRVIELELIEPYLYPRGVPELGDRFADALLRLLS